VFERAKQKTKNNKKKTTTTPMATLHIRASELLATAASITHEFTMTLKNFC